MRTADLQFNIIYTPGTVRYLTPFVTTLLQYSDCRYRLVANGCSAAECDLLRAICALSNRLELLVMPEQRMVPHGETLNFLHARTTGDYFCFMDSDILATGPFLEDFGPDLAQADVFSSCLPLWHNTRDITIPAHFRHMHGIHAYTDTGLTIACDYFVVYNKAAFDAARATTGADLAVCGWQQLSPANQQLLQSLGQQRADYDSGKVLTLLMAARGARIRFRQSDRLLHIGGFTEAGTQQGGLLYSRGRLDQIANAVPYPMSRAMLHIADTWYAWRHGPAENDRRENLDLASRIRRRSTTARYFYRLIVGLMDDKPLPALPRLGDQVAEKRLADASHAISKLVSEVRRNAGPWQDGNGRL